MTEHDAHSEMGGQLPPSPGPTRALHSNHMDAKFPVPEEEAHKLDYVEHSLAQQPLVQKLGEAVRAQPWPFVVGAALLGFLCGLALGGD